MSDRGDSPPSPVPMVPARITGLGVALPDKTVTNADLAAYLDTDDAWITERTGIRERRVGGTTSGLATEAARAAMAAAGVGPADIDILILATTTPDQTMPGASATVQHDLGLRCGAFDLNAACAGFTYAMWVANGLLATTASCALVVGSDVMSGIVDWDDRATAILFGDGAGAAVFSRAEGSQAGILGTDIGCDGALAPILFADRGGFIEMKGREVFRHAVRAVADSALAALHDAGVEPAQVDLVVPHQANVRIVDAICARVGIAPERAVVNVEQVGNTSAASIPIALADAQAAGRLQPGSLVLLTGFGAGMTWSSLLMRW